MILLLNRRLVLSQNLLEFGLRFVVGVLKNLHDDEASSIDGNPRFGLK
jgi:hypothetical protein